MIPFSSLGKYSRLIIIQSYTLRCAVVEVSGNLIIDLTKQEEPSENHKTQINAFFDVLEERFLDINPYCRCRAIQVYLKICDLEQKFPKRRQAASELAARSLEDKSSNVRRNAIKLLAKLVSTHPFSVMHGGQLSYTEWNARLEAVDAELNALRPPETPGFDEDDAMNVDSELLDDATQMPDDSPSKAPRMTRKREPWRCKKLQSKRQHLNCSRNSSWPENITARPFVSLRFSIEPPELCLDCYHQRIRARSSRPWTSS